MNFNWQHTERDGLPCLISEDGRTYLVVVDGVYFPHVFDRDGLSHYCDTNFNDLRECEQWLQYSATVARLRENQTVDDFQSALIDLIHTHRASKTHEGGFVKLGKDGVE